MKQLILLAVTSFSIFACTSSGGKKERELIAIAHKYMESVETRNIGIMDSLLADNYMGYGPSVSDSTNKKDALSNWKNNIENLYESIEYTGHKEVAVTVKEGLAQGDWVIL